MTLIQSYVKTLAALPMTLVVAFSLFAEPAHGHNPVDYLEVFAASAGVPVEHDVDLACEGFFERKSISLVGPTHFSASVGCSGKSAPKQGVFMHWYQIASEESSVGTKELKTLDFLRNSKNLKLEIATTPSFLLSPSQLLGSGEPAPVPDGLDHFLAFEVRTELSLDKEVEITGGLTSSKSSRKLGKAKYICVPAHEWHHDEEFEVTHRLTCLVAYSIGQSSGEESKVSTLDQFGLNQLTTKGASQLLLVRGALLK